MHNILIVDDEEIVLELEAVILELSGYKVTSFSEPEKALGYYRENYKDFDLVILDMMMPKMNGNILFKKMKESNPQIKAIIVSGYLEEKDMEDAIKHGLKGFMKKPVKPQDFIRKIEETIKGDIKSEHFQT
ncbi:MAG: response regulator [Spirochaetales bacterium]|nr:response regulator [Spirochaetales bacterium]